MWVGLSYTFIIGSELIQKSALFRTLKHIHIYLMLNLLAAIISSSVYAY